MKTTAAMSASAAGIATKIHGLFRAVLSCPCFSMGKVSPQMGHSVALAGMLSPQNGQVLFFMIWNGIVFYKNRHTFHRCQGHIRVICRPWNALGGRMMNFFVSLCDDCPA
ncbi:MAG: hypothetical protein J6O01_03040 [Bacteroidales bacterium]|nr:hypothetical protein [Bacteroidales bacterium]